MGERGSVDDNASGIKQVNYRLTSHQKAHKRYYRLEKMEDYDMVLVMEDDPKKTDKQARAIKDNIECQLEDE